MLKMLTVFCEMEKIIDSWQYLTVLFSNYVKFSCVLTSNEMITNMFNATYNTFYLFYVKL